MSLRVAEKTALVDQAIRVARRTIEIGYPKWDWGEGVAWHGVAAAGIQLREQSLIEATSKWLHSHAQTTPNELRQVMPGLAAAVVHEATGDQTALTLARRVIELLANTPRNVHGVYRESLEIPVWVDYWYEITPFLTAMARLTHDPQPQAWAVEQSIAFVHSCWDPRASLYHHAYYDLNRSTSQWFWARANGWAALAAVEMASDLGDVPGVQPVLLNVLRQHLDRVVELQDGSGLWHTVMDQPTTYLEVSASIMLALALKRAVRRDYVGKAFESHADRAFAASLKHVDAEGNVNQVSAETVPGDIMHYSQIPLGVYPWGQGFTILAILEWLGGQS